jgi:hypothetical protein
MAPLPVVNRWLDLLDRVGWTAIQAAAAAGIVVLSGTGVVEWKGALLFVASAAGVAVLKVIVGQRTGTDDTGSLIGTSVIEPPPEATTTPAPRR